ncbi:tetratricopeptide repeat protein [Roseomonas sp. BN140053]|uniref:tetratricopeptide repeat protein n=1 Tax=Roseomonas sp. BN140053 TaxID=3391898 RepID=UPI0039E7FC38
MMPVPCWPGSHIALLAAALLISCPAIAAPAQTPPGNAVADTAPHGAFGPYLAGRFAASAADTAAAAFWLLDASRRDPDQILVLDAAFLAAVMDGQADATRLARQQNNNQLAALLLAGADAQAGRWDRAEQRLRGLPRQGSVQILQPLLIAWAQAGRGATDTALATLRPFAESGPMRGLVSLHAAMIADLADRPRDAERLLRTALAAMPEPSLRMVQVAAGILARAGHAADGARLFDGLARGTDDVALAASPALRRAALGGRPVASAVEGMAEAQLALGSALRSQGTPDLAVVLARLALRLRPGFAPALLLAAEALADGNHPGSALAVLSAAHPDDELAPLVTLRRAMLLDGADRTEEALTTLRQLAAAQPAAAQPPARLGDVLRGRGRFPEAVAAYTEALSRLAPGTANWPLHYALGIALERAGRWEEAEAEFGRALSLAPDQPAVLNYLAYSWADRGLRLPEARRMLERAAELRPQDGSIADSLGWVMFRQGDLRGAVEALERATELESRNATINDHLGDAYWAVGRLPEARFQWSRALDLGPEPAEAERLLTKLRDGLSASTAAR